MDVCIGLVIGFFVGALALNALTGYAVRKSKCPTCNGSGVFVPSVMPEFRQRIESKRPRGSRRRTPGTSPPPPAEDLFVGSSSPPSQPAGAEHPHLPKLRAFVRFGLVAARADGRIAASEKRAIREFLTETFGHDAALLRHVDPLMERAEKDADAEVDVFAALLSVTTEGERFTAIRFAERVLDSTGKRTAKKRQFRERVVESLNAIDPVSREAKPSAAPPPPDPRTVLEIDPDTELSPELIRRKYSLLSDKLDAGKATAMGTDFARLALEKRTALRTAAEALIAPFGVPLDPPAAPPPPADIRHNPDLDDIFGG